MARYQGAILPSLTRCHWRAAVSGVNKVKSAVPGGHHVCLLPQVPLPGAPSMGPQLKVASSLTSETSPEKLEVKDKIFEDHCFEDHSPGCPISENNSH